VLWRDRRGHVRPEVGAASMGRKVRCGRADERYVSDAGESDLPSRGAGHATQRREQ